MKNMFQPIHFSLDTDHDGVWDWKDCQPFNFYKQDDLIADYQKTHDINFKDALALYHNNTSSMEQRINHLVDAHPHCFSHNHKYDSWDATIVKYDKNIFYIFDKTAGVEHYILINKSKKYPVIGLFSKPYSRYMSNANIRAMVDWAYENVIKFLKGGKKYV